MFKLVPTNEELAGLRAAYLLLHDYTTPGTYGRSSLQVLHRGLFPEEYPEQRDYCPYCLSWKGGPMMCCKDHYERGGELPELTKSEADAKRAARAA